MNTTDRITAQENQDYVGIQLTELVRDEHPEAYDATREYLIEEVKNFKESFIDTPTVGEFDEARIHFYNGFKRGFEAGQRQ